VPLVYAIAIQISFFNISMGLALYGFATVAGALRMNSIFHESFQPQDLSG
jgi:hypothetical protein